MTRARECDVCGALHRMERGAITVDVHQVTKVESDGETVGGWDGVDLCKACAKKLIAILRPALRGLKP